MKQIFQSKTPTIEAVQYFGDSMENAIEIIKLIFLEDEVFTEKQMKKFHKDLMKFPVGVVIDKEGNKIEVGIGEWVVKRPDGSITTMTQQQIEDGFEPVKLNPVEQMMQGFTVDSTEPDLYTTRAKITVRKHDGTLIYQESTIYEEE